MATRKSISLAKAAARQGVTTRRMRQLCSQDLIPGAHRVERRWLVPGDFERIHGTRGPKPRGARLTRTPAPAQAAPVPWRNEFPERAKAHDEAIATYPGARISP